MELVVRVGRMAIKLDVPRALLSFIPRVIHNTPTGAQKEMLLFSEAAS